MAKEAVKKPKREVSGGVKSYLLAYNLVETIGWAYLLYLLITYYVSETRTQSLYQTVAWPLFIFQNAAILEVVHTVIHIVPSNPFVTALQVASRVIVVCGILLVTQAAKDSIGLPLALMAWSVTEVIRYANYALNLAGGVPFPILWLRYSTFIILYPIGITGELLCIYAAHNEVGETKLFTLEMPNTLNFIFNYQFMLKILMFSYIPVFPKLYLHMWTLRRKVLGGGSQKKEN